MNVDTVPRTLLVAAAVGLCCATFVSLAVDQLRPKQLQFEVAERYRTVLSVAGLLPEGAPEKDVAAAFRALDIRVVDLETDWYADGVDAASLNHWSALAEPGPDDEQRDAERYVPVYLVASKDASASIVVPVHGPGMWSTIYGYVALDANSNVIIEAVFHRHGETPGIGDRIQDSAWLETWRGKRLRDADGAMRFRVTENASGPFEVDAISGATITAEATGTLVAHWLGDQGLGAFLQNLANAEGRR